MEGSIKEDTKEKERGGRPGWPSALLVQMLYLIGGDSGGRHLVVMCIDPSKL